MPAVPTGTITAFCTEQGAALKIDFAAAEITADLRDAFAKRLSKKGLTVQWTRAQNGAQVLIRIVQVDQGNQLLRYLLPFIAPAILEVEGQIALAGAAPRDFHFVQRAQIGLFGGSARGMLKVCAQRVADKIAKDLTRQMGI